MPLHDWTRVEAWLFHDFHLAWIAAIQTSLNDGLLPEGHYGLIEQHTGSKPEAPPQVQRKQVIGPVDLTRRRSLAIRHVSNHRLIALIEIVSPSNKDRAETVEEFATKAASALHRGVHLLMVDLFPPGRHDPQGMHGAILQRLNPYEEPYDLPPGTPLTLSAYVAPVAGLPTEVYLEHLAVSSVLPNMPLFLRPDRYIYVPLEATYQTAYRGMPAFWREVLEKG